MSVYVKRIYEDYSEKDGQRILVDRIWPRGISKKKAKIDQWLKRVAPSTELRKWFNHDPAKFKEFRDKYEQELIHDKEKYDALYQMKELAERKSVTLIYAAKDKNYNHAQILKNLIEQGDGENR